MLIFTLDVSFLEWEQQVYRKHCSTMTLQKFHTQINMFFEHSQLEHQLQVKCHNCTGHETERCLQQGQKSWYSNDSSQYSQVKAAEGAQQQQLQLSISSHTVWIKHSLNFTMEVEQEIWRYLNTWKPADLNICQMSN